MQPPDSTVSQLNARDSREKELLWMLKGNLILAGAIGIDAKNLLKGALNK